ncbi:MAG: hypothetical protein Q4G49_02325 [Paracoccus sp. (in: a-proteobacteria)]|nr:hypothetical protein [Paracoccus sp. (in: a-proteobacteria)]
MELTPVASPAFDAPQDAFDDYRPGMSPYIHRWLDLNGRLTAGDEGAPPVSTRTEAALRGLIDAALGQTGGSPSQDDLSGTAYSAAP